MSKIFLWSVVITVGSFLAGGGARALMPSPDAPVFPHMPFPIQTPMTPLPSIPESIPLPKNPPLAVQPILPLPNNWPLFEVISARVSGTIQSVSTSFSFIRQPVTSTDDIAEFLQLAHMTELSIARVNSSTAGVITLFVPGSNTTTKIIVFDRTIIRNLNHQRIDTTGLVPGDTITIYGLRFEGSQRLILADLIETNSRARLPLEK